MRDFWKQQKDEQGSNQQQLNNDWKLYRILRTVKQISPDTKHLKEEQCQCKRERLVNFKKKMEE